MYQCQVASDLFVSVSQASYKHISQHFEAFNLEEHC